MHRSLTGLIAKIIAVGLFVLFGAILFSNPVGASGGVGGGDGGSGSSGGGSYGYPYSSNGFGWHIFRSDGSYRPDYFRNGDSWASVANICRNTNFVIAFVVMQDRTADGSHGTVYKDDGGWGTYGYLSGGNWISYSQASNMFHSLPASMRAGYTFRNNVAWFCYGNRAATWSVNGQSYIQVAANSGVGPNASAHRQTTQIATPGNRLYWWHDMRNVGPDAMDRDVSYQINKSGFSNGWTGNTSPSGSARGGVNQLFMMNYPGGPYTTYDVTQDDVGRTLCQQLSWAPRSSSNAARANSAGTACASVPYSYTLTPNVTVNPDETVDPGTEITITPNITDGGPTKSRPTDWELTFVTVPPNVGVPGGNTNSTAPCSNYRPTSTINCRTIGSGNGVFNPGNNPLPISRENTPDVPVGTKLCFGLSVRPPSSSAATNIWLHSNLTCIIVAKSPLVQVRGGDLIVGRNTAGAEVRTSTKVTGGTHYGSWTEYGIIAPGRIFGMASGAGYAGGVAGLAATPQCSVSQLTFANSTISGATTAPKCASDSSVGATAGFGNYALSGTAPSVASRFPIIAGVTPSLPITGSGTARKAVINPASLASGNYQASGNFTLEMTGTVQAGKWIVINAPNSTVTISTDIRINAGASLTSRTQIPQVVIIANNINIAGSVQQIDAWLLAMGTGANGVLNTCTDVAKPHAGQCNNLLTVNGPIQANHLILNRTAGSGTGARSGDPAEVFNLRADAYLWATAAVPGNNRVPTVYTKELPPRF